LFPTINKLGRLPSTSVINSLWFVAAKCIALAAGKLHSTQWSQTLAQNRDFCLSHLHSTLPLRGVSVEKLPCRLVRKNYNGVATRWWKDFEDMFSHFDRIHERVRWTHTDTAWWLRPRLHNIVRQKSSDFDEICCTIADTEPDDSHITNFF